MEKPVGPVGFKCLRYNPIDNAFYSFVYGTSKWDNNKLVAECLNTHLQDVYGNCFAIQPHSAPEKVCTCGIYTANEWQLTSEYMRNRSFTDLVPTLVLIEASGNIIEHEYGFRCEQAKIIAIVRDRKVNRLELCSTRDPGLLDYCGLPIVTLRKAKKLVGKRRFVPRRFIQGLYNVVPSVLSEAIPYVFILLIVIVLSYWVWSMM